MLIDSIGFLSIQQAKKLRFSKFQNNELAGMDKSPLCKRLKEARLAAGLSQKQLGIAAGMDQFSASARMNHYEKGRHTPDYSMLRRIAAVLKLPVAYFYAESDELATLIKIFLRVKKSERSAVLKQLESI